MPPANPDSAAALIDASAPGRAAGSLTAHFPALYRDLVRFIARRTGNDDARDLAHDTWLRLAEHERSQGHAVPAHIGAYLFTVAHHLAIDHLRRRRAAGDVALAPACSEPDVADAVMYRQAVQAIEAALQALPERARDVFLQHRLLGVGQAELAERHGLSRNMIERDVMLAMDHVQVAVERWHGSGTSAARKGRRRSLAALLGLAGLCTIGGAAWQAWRHLVPQWQLALSSRRGQTVRRTLPDGSELTLDARSQADVSFFAAQRRVRLHAGAAFFSVARDAARPFVVDAGAARVTVLGTRFAVELAGDSTEVQVESGRVQVQALDAHARGGEPVLLREGQTLRVLAAPSGGAGDVRIEHSTARSAVAAPWRTGMLVFDSTPLGDAVQRLDRYGATAVTVDRRVAALPVSGQVRIAQAHDWLLALPAVLPVRVQRTADADAGWHIGPS
jgi:RNA polymerase sigma factor (sigma-70 family)